MSKPESNPCGLCGEELAVFTTRNLSHGEDVSWEYCAECGYDSRFDIGVKENGLDISA